MNSDITIKYDENNIESNLYYTPTFNQKSGQTFPWITTNNCYRIKIMNITSNKKLCNQDISPISEIVKNALKVKVGDLTYDQHTFSEIKASFEPSIHETFNLDIEFAFKPHLLSKLTNQLLQIYFGPTLIEKDLYLGENENELTDLFNANVELVSPVAKMACGIDLLSQLIAETEAIASTRPLSPKDEEEGRRSFELFCAVNQESLSTKAPKSQNISPAYSDYGTEEEESFKLIDSSILLESNKTPMAERNAAYSIFEAELKARETRPGETRSTDIRVDTDLTIPDISEFTNDYLLDLKSPRGMPSNLQLVKKMDSLHVFLRADAPPIKQFSPIGFFGGEFKVIPFDDYDTNPELLSTSYQIDSSFEFDEEVHVCIITSINSRNFTSHFNYSSEPNVNYEYIKISNDIEAFGEFGDTWQVVFYALTEIQPGSLLTIDYGDDYVKSHPGLVDYAKNPIYLNKDGKVVQANEVKGKAKGKRKGKRSAKPAKRTRYASLQIN